ncbi:MAG: trbL/VirB6 plasmid conjugal transfer family protein [Candidatus Xenolissoclinum pacificiensis L6]|uniref:TrbL/VirB6 plasmid conjugal transfer family protein n=1 Tax=Candidatus Xenolissoclinum pacificiensis L6 TaxID=1401685 RepID=W2V0L4_9RICK|nr:MAG: trbL/VirB6 plasmid conjugal transfer family protein [Candidatus Xenolissoclinum pacificiensis L6]
MISIRARLISFLFCVVICFIQITCYEFTFLSKKAHAEVNYESTSYATYPECGTDNLMSYIISGAAIILGIIPIIGGLYLAPTLTSKAVARIMFANILPIIIGITQLSSILICKYSFVRDPVLRYRSNGNYKTCANPYTTVDQYGNQIGLCPEYVYKQDSEYRWPYNQSPYSDYMDLCYRVPPLLIMFPFLAAIVTIPAVLVMLPIFMCVDGWENCKNRLEIKELNDPDRAFVDFKITMAGTGVPPAVCKTVKADQRLNISGANYNVFRKGKQICAQLYGLKPNGAVADSTFDIGCHYMEPSPPDPMCATSKAIVDSEGIIVDYDNTTCTNCYISASCLTGEKGSVAFSRYPITFNLIQCLQETLLGVVTGKGCEQVQGSDEDTVSKQHGKLNYIIARLKDGVILSIVLAIILFGYKVGVGVVKEHKEWILFCIKIVAISYFVLGDGLIFWYGQLLSLSSGAANMVFEAATYTENGICNFSEDYGVTQVVTPKTSFELSNDYLSVWDRLDCRIAFYTGYTLLSQDTGASVPIVGVIGTILFHFVLLFTMIFSGYLLFALALMVMMIVLFSMIIWTVHLFILSLLAISILVLFAPLFFPMWLFKPTEMYFKGWYQQLFGYALYPMVIFTYLAISFVAYDAFYFEQLTFERKDSEIFYPTGASRIVYDYVLSPVDQCDNTKNLACLFSSVKMQKDALEIFQSPFRIETLTLFSYEDFPLYFSKISIMIVVFFLFYHFSVTLGSMAAELMGSFRTNIDDMSDGDGGIKTIAGKLGQPFAAAGGKMISLTSSGISAISSEAQSRVQGRRAGIPTDSKTQQASKHTSKDSSGDKDKRGYDPDKKTDDFYSDTSNDMFGNEQDDLFSDKSDSSVGRGMSNASEEGVEDAHNTADDTIGNTVNGTTDSTADDTIGNTMNNTTDSASDDAVRRGIYDPLPDVTEDREGQDGESVYENIGDRSNTEESIYENIGDRSNTEESIYSETGEFSDDNVKTLDDEDKK